MKTNNNEKILGRRSPKNKYWAELSAQYRNGTNETADSFGDMSLESLKGMVKDAASHIKTTWTGRRGSKCEQVKVIISKNKAIYPNFDWVIEDIYTL